MVVDDEEHLALMFRSALTDRGYPCDAVTSPHEALKRMQRGNYAVLVSDIMMPLMSGISLMQKVQEIKPDTKVIFVTGVNNVDTAVQAIKMGAADFIPKPFDLDKLCESVDKAARDLPREGSGVGRFEKPDTQHCGDLPGYRIIKKIGSGAMGAVFQARQVTLDRFVAVKLIRPSAFQDQTALQRFMREARAAAKMNHPNIIQVYDLMEYSEYVFLIMEYYPSRSLSDVVREMGPLPPSKAAWIALQICRALIHSSAQGIVHRDVKPDNILIGKGWTAKLTDFGLAKELTVIDDGGQGDATRIGHIVGTPSYLSPEQAISTPDIDVRGDIYSLGLSTFFMLEGRHPYTGNISDLIMSHINRPLPPIEAPGVAGPFKAVIRRMVEKDRDDRYQSAGALLAAFRQLMSDTSGQSSDSLPEP